MMKAAVGSRWDVRGSRSAMVSAGPMPGRMPVAVPSVTPSNAQPRLARVRAVAKPWSRAFSVCMAASSRSEPLDPAGQDARRQLQMQTDGEPDIDDDGDQQSHDPITNIAPAAEA